MPRLSWTLVSGLVLLVAIWPSAFASLFESLFRQDQQILPNEGTAAASSRIPDLLYHLGGNGPWVPKTVGTVEGGMEPPHGCRITQLHMLARHAERYPTLAAGTRMWSLYQRIQHSDIPLNGSLAFATDWEFFIDSSADLEQLVSTGPHAGTLQAFSTGVKLRTRYKHLLDSPAANGSQIRYWASDSARITDTARYFAAGFFGLGSAPAKLEIIPETPDRGADTLTPGLTCRKYQHDTDQGHLYGQRMSDAFRGTYEPAVVARLAAENPAFPFTAYEIYTMQTMCGFEAIAKGSSPWCDVFTAEDWANYAHARDLLHYYRSGPGNPYSAVMGLPWLKASASLLAKGSDSAESSADPQGEPGQPPKPQLFFSFTHDTDLLPILTALAISTPPEHLPTTHIPANHTYRTSSLIPMSAHLIFERLTCAEPSDCWSNAPFYPNHVYCAPPSEGQYVRVLVNDAVVAVPGCEGGPGHGCPVGEFVANVNRAREREGSFGRRCGLRDGEAEGLTFLHR